MTKLNRTAAKILLTLFLFLFVTGIAACNNNDEYTVTWKNADGEVLETDNNVKKGTIPTYDGATPVKASDAQYTYTFAGWDREIIEVTSDVTYTATFTAYANKYTVIWQNYNGHILETDTDVAYGAMPSYDGDTPQKEGTGDVSYVFSGWTPSVNTVTGDVTYTAQFLERNNGELVAGVNPIISADGKTVQYGFYPQTRVSDEALIAELNMLTPSNVNGWYLHNGDYYVKETANVCNNENYQFDDKTQIITGTDYWFKCEIITWRVLANADGSYYLLSDKLLDARNYYAEHASRTVNGKTVYANNYEQSGIREWLNGEFYNTAFALNNTYIQLAQVNNGADTTDLQNNAYACANTMDKVFLPSYQDYLNAAYGFGTNAAETSSSRECKTTDYARARGAWCNTKTNLSYNGSYWTRSPSGEYDYCAWNVNTAGYLSQYAVSGDSHCVRPCISITFASEIK